MLYFCDRILWVITPFTLILTLGELSKTTKNFYISKIHYIEKKISSLFFNMLKYDGR